MKNKYYLWIVIAGLLVLWILSTMVFKIITSTFLPSPLEIIVAFGDMSGMLGGAILASLEITMSGLLLGLVAGVLIGLVMAYSKAFMDIVGPIMEFTRPIPVFALIPLFMLWFGLGLMPQILLIALGVMAIMGVQTYEAIRNMPMVYIRAAFNLGANKGQVFQTVVIPYIFPHLIGAIRVAAASAWGLDVAAEFMGVQVGLGYTMIIQQVYLNIPGIMVVVIIYSTLAILLDKLIQYGQSRLTRWTERASVSFEGIVPVKNQKKGLNYDY
jgi:ABC-type nitrate/sulfonate/bicarbonate transport system permease component